MCMNAAPSSQGLAMATYTWKMNNEVVRPLCFPHHSRLRAAPMNICKANWLSFFQNLPSFRCLQINSTAARSSVLRNQRYTNQYHLMFCFTLPIFPVLLGVHIASLSCVFTPSTTKTVLIHDYGAPVLPKTPTSNTLLWWPLGSPCFSQPQGAPSWCSTPTVILMHHFYLFEK